MARPVNGASTAGRWGLLGLGLLIGAAATVGLIYGVTLWVGTAAAGEAGAAPVFEAVDSGLDHVYDGEFEHYVGGGLAVLDCNDDGLPDVYVAGGSGPAGLYVNESEPGGDLVFEVDPNATTDLTGVTGAYPIDIDSDQLGDLVVLRRGENVVLRGLGDCSFEDATEVLGVAAGDHWTVGFSAFWDDANVLPTLAFGNYLEMDSTPNDQRCADHFLIAPLDDESYAEPQTLSPGYCTLSILFSDWGRTGSPDLRMTNDRHYYTDGSDQLWAMSDLPAEYTSADGWRQLEIWGMGIASQDLDADGFPEVYLTSQGDNKLQTLADTSGAPAYEDIALATGVTAHRPFAGDTLRPSTAWHAEFDDTNNDGFVDLFVTKGNVEDQVDFAAEDPNNLFLGQPDGTFVEGAEPAGLLDMARSRGGAVVDLNLDGFLDVVVVERREPVKVWRNSGRLSDGTPAGSWLLIDLEQAGPNTDAIGGWIEVEADRHSVSKEVTIGGGHASGESGWTHFGLGGADQVRVRVVWPDGEVSDWERLDGNQMIKWNRATGPEVWTIPAN